MAKRLVLILLALVLSLASLAAAEENNNAQETGIGFNFTSTYRSAWLGPIGHRTSGPIILNEITQDLGGGFYAYVWNLNGLGESGSDETDLFLGWAGDVSGFKLDVGIAYWDLRGRFTASGPNTDFMNFWFEVGKEFAPAPGHKLLPFIRAEHVEPVKMNGSGSEGGFQGFLGIRHDWEAGKFLLPLSVKSEIKVAYDSGLYGGEAAFLLRVGTQLSWKVNDIVSVILPGLDFSRPFEGDLKDGRGTELVGWAGISLSF